MKTPEEIKKGLREAPHVKYFADDPSSADGRDVRYGVVIGYVLREEIVALIERLAQAERERDAALHDLKLSDSDKCAFCKHINLRYELCAKNGYDCVACADHERCGCLGCTHNENKWEWRGICAKNSKEGKA